jgi:hypothetical protein
MRISGKIKAEAESRAEKAETEASLRFRVALECGAPAAFAR